MNRRNLLAASALGAMAPIAAIANEASPVASPDAVSTLRESGYIPIGELEMYHEVHGSGEGVPLVLLHGAFGSIGTYFADLVPLFATDRTVIGLEMQGHGHTGDIDRPLTYDQLAADTDAAIAALGYDRADIFGYSLGGIVALTLAVTNPGRIRAFAIAGAHWNNDGWRDVDRQAIENLNPSYFPPEFVEMVEAENPVPGNFPVLVEKIHDLEVSWPGFTTEQIASIPIPVLIMAGDSDGFTLAHIVEMYELVGGGGSGDLEGIPASQLSILPGTSHTGILMHAPTIHAQVSGFLNG